MNVDALDEQLMQLADGLHRVRLRDGRRAIAKVRHDAAPDFFAAEARGLVALAATSSLRVPALYACERYAIVIEDLGNGRPDADAWEHAGANLARVHRVTASTFGFDADGWCGDTPQDNTRCVDGHRFFAERRLAPQLHRARETGLLDRRDVARIERIGERLVDLVPSMRPALIHGDLWTANLHACANGELALIDAGAVHYGWAEGDLAMLTLFGAPPARFFSAYENESGVELDWRERAPIYNLYHLLNHLNLFGASYLGSVRDIANRYG